MSFLGNKENAIRSGITKKEKVVALMLICQLVGDMGTKFWCITLFVLMLVTEVT